MKYLVILVLLAAGVGISWFYVKSKGADAAAAGAGNVQTKQVVRMTLEKVITANGKIASNRDVDIKCQASGKVISAPFDVSQVVHKGDVLLALDPVDEKRSFDQSEVQVSSSQARLAQAKLAYDQAAMSLVTTKARNDADLASAKAKAADSHSKANRTQALFDAKPTPLASKEELETALTSAAQADAQVAQALASMEELKQQEVSVKSKVHDIALAESQVRLDQIKRDLAKQQLDYCTVTSPVDGVVSTMNVQVGNIVQSGSGGFSGGTTVMTISDLSHIFVLASVDESDIGNVVDPTSGRTPQRAHVTVDAYPRQIFEGMVVRVASKGVNTSNVVTFEVKVEVTDEKKSLLKPEMTGTAKIVTDSREQALVVPVQAFMRKQEEAPASQSAVVAASQPASQPVARGGRGGRGGRSGGGGGGLPDEKPQEGTVAVMEGGKSVNHEITVGMSNGEFYEVVAGDLKEGDEVVLNAFGADSRWRNNGPNAQQMSRMLGGGGGGRGR